MGGTQMGLYQKLQIFDAILTRWGHREAPAGPAPCAGAGGVQDRGGAGPAAVRYEHHEAAGEDGGDGDDDDDDDGTPGTSHHRESAGVSA